ncbi:AEC family transporter [Trueperella abortisuis]|uniref:AEC family transporter n=1 Tax=Trueperella abortisuis TaxID=445930 RepID=UPI0028930933|nr:AEC family transporter [Trueperella abortisuis]
MNDVLLSIWTLLVYTAIGVALAKCRVVRPDADRGLSRIVFFVTMPALLMRTVDTAHLADVFSRGLIANILTALILLGLYYAIGGKFGLSGPERTVGAMAGAYTNAGNVGIAYLLATVGQATAAAGVIMFQVLVLVPFAFFMLDKQTGSAGAGFMVRAGHALMQPPLLSVLTGLAINLSGWHLPRAVTVPIDALADATVPVMMIAMGVSLASAKLRRGKEAVPVVASVGFRVMLSPIITFVIAMALGLQGTQLLAAMVVSVFPTANNLFAIAHRYEAGVALVRDAGVASALASMPMLVIVAAIFYG